MDVLISSNSNAFLWSSFPANIVNFIKEMGRRVRNCAAHINNNLIICWDYVAFTLVYFMHFEESILQVHIQHASHLNEVIEIMK